ncbi:thaumatin-like protein 1b [Euphorbia lathyris]|uniref:thaumatin-like protein 1b n=1 Tax=Euphorbia lathyris TaxID=212925 RepID=UPI0033131D32
MAQRMELISLCALFSLHMFISGVVSTSFTMTNKCEYTVWPGLLSNADSPPLSTTGFALQKGETKTITAPTSWGGRMWGRTHCSQDSTGKFTCLTGDCGSGKLECSGSGAAPPATLAEFKLDGYGGMDYFDVSLVDGYNLPVLVVPQGGSGNNCSSTGCVVDLNGLCPSELKVSSTDGGGVACKSACEAFRQPEYCCNGAFATPDTCKPSSYSEIFKKACPSAYSYAYDDKTSTFTCNSADYLLTFCPTPNTSQKASQGQNPDTTTNGNGNDNGNNGATTNTMVYEGALDQSGDSSSSTSSHVLRSHAIAGIVSIISAVWLFRQF